MKIWGRPTSICTQRVLWACTEANVDVELTLASATMGADGHVSTGASPYGTVGTPGYAKMNPNATVPTIDDDGFVLWESNAIVAYVAAAYAPHALYGDSPQQIARALQWMSWTNEHLEPPLHTLIMELKRLAPALRNEGAVAATVKAAAPSLLILDAHLAHSPYVAGEMFSMGDIPTAAAAYRWGVFDLNGPNTPNIDAWLARLAHRDGFARHIAPTKFHV
ncbi:MAG: glutathione S-transferase family protein [Chromatiales bacterium]|nr:glutathione S-transferase family protein [Chromatiales bacterium]